MEARIVKCPFGILAFNDKNEMVGKMLFHKNPRESVKTLAKIEGGKVTSEVAKLLSTLQEKGYDCVILEDAKLAERIGEELGIEVRISKPSQAGEMLSSHMEKFAIETGFVKDAEMFKRWMHDIAIETAKLRVKKAAEKRDLIIIQAIQTLDDVDRTVNRFMGRVREWYGVHFPELDRLMSNHETYARLVFKLGSRENFAEELLEEEAIPKPKTRDIIEAAEKSMGADLTQTDITQIQSLCKSILDQYQLRQRLEEYLEITMEEVAPNTKAIVGALLGARLISMAGGLLGLAKMPSSTIQVLGAEKALFRSLKTGTPPPKHGIIFQHNLLHEAKKGQRGKLARAIAGKVAIAARADALGSRYIGEKLKKELEKRVEEIQGKQAT